MVEKTQTDYFDEVSDERTLKIYLPDGHLERGGVAKIWRATRLPYPKRKQLYVVVESDELHNKYGYPTDHVDRIVLISRRPHNIPTSINNFGGVGISGEDFIRDRLDIPIDSDQIRYADTSGNAVESLLNLQCMPASILAAFRRDYMIRDAKNVRDAMARFAEKRGGRALIASEFPQLTMYAMVDIFGVDEAIVEVFKTDGATEPFAVWDCDGMVDVAQTGGSIVANDLRAVRPEVLKKTTPHTIVRTDTLSYHEPIVKELKGRLQKGVDNLMRDEPEAFVPALSKETFA